MDGNIPMARLHKYWVSFERLERPIPLNLGCGVTAYDRDDAIGLIRKLIFGNCAMPRISRITDDVELQDLNQGHVAPNVGDASVRGIWFPQGFNNNLG